MNIEELKKQSNDKLSEVILSSKKEISEKDFKKSILIIGGLFAIIVGAILVLIGGLLSLFIKPIIPIIICLILFGISMGTVGNGISNLFKKYNEIKELMK